LHFAEAHGTSHAYGVGTHRHTVEIERELGAELLFVPHLAPTSRGLLVTAYARLRDDVADPNEILRTAYRGEPFVVVSDQPPGLKDALGSNVCFVHAVTDRRTGWLVAMASLDNLTKGAAGQAVQALNVALGFHETSGLSRVAVAP
jgi:N-acetyl-gamma-glutamyl-phosphate reductase